MHQIHRRRVVQQKNTHLVLEWTTLGLLESISSTEEELSNRTLTQGQRGRHEGCWNASDPQKRSCPKKNTYLGLVWTTLRLLEDIRSTDDVLSNRRTLTQGQHGRHEGCWNASDPQKRSCPTQEHLPRVSIDDTKIAGRHQFHRRGVVQHKEKSKTYTRLA